MIRAYSEVDLAGGDIYVALWWTDAKGRDRQTQRVIRADSHYGHEARRIFDAFAHGVELPNVT